MEIWSRDEFVSALTQFARADGAATTMEVSLMASLLAMILLLWFTDIGEPFIALMRGPADAFAGMLDDIGL